METESRPSSNSSPVPPNTNLLIVRLLMLGKEVGSIIGKEGKNVKRFREESGARINISDSSSPERIVTLVGSIESIASAFRMICAKFLEDMDLNTQNGIQPSEVWTTPLTIRLLIPACQCGCLIGKGGTKIKELRQMTGASIQVASEVLPNSMERAITLSGNYEPITRCFEYVCHMLSESPPKGPIIPYRPKGASTAAVAQVVNNGFVQANAVRSAPVVPQTLLISGNHATPFILQSQFSLSPIAQNELNKLSQLQQSLNGSPSTSSASQIFSGSTPHAALQGLPHSVLTGSPLLNISAVLRNVNLLTSSGNSAVPTGPQQSHEITIPNDWVGCVIGRGGVKINEIRHLSGAVIKISPCEDGRKERNITITGSPDAINVALYLIQARISAELLSSGGFVA